MENPKTGVWQWGRVALASLFLLPFIVGSLIWVGTPLLQAAGAFCLVALDALKAYLDQVDQNLPLALLLGLLIVVPSLLSGARQLVNTRSLIHGLLLLESHEWPRKLAEAARRAGPVQIRLISSPEFHSFCFGLLRPQICLSTAVVEQLSVEELEAVLRHEACHSRRHDPLKILLANAVAAGFFGLPFSKTWANSSRKRQELAADAAVVREMGNKLPLASALLKAINFSPMPSLGSEAGAFGALDARIEQLVHEKRTESPTRGWRSIKYGKVPALLIVICLMMTASSVAARAVCWVC